jgi:hypothetical protein
MKSFDVIQIGSNAEDISAVIKFALQRISRVIIAKETFLLKNMLIKFVEE